MTPASIDPDAVTLAGFEPLRRAERLLVNACASGGIAKVGLRRPEAAGADVTIRASFLSFVLRGGLPLRARLLNLLGAFVEGRLDLGAANIRGSLWFYRCTFDSAVLLDGSHVAGALTFAGCHLSSLQAQDCSVATDLTMNAGCVISHELRLSRARIGADLKLSRLDLSGAGTSAQPRRALLADAVRVGGNVRLVDGFQAVGEVRFSAARVRGDFEACGLFNGNQVPNGSRAVALMLDRMVVGGSVHFAAGFGAAGGVALSRARIGGDFDATGASFDWLGDASWGDGASLALDHARIGGTLKLCELREPLLGASFAWARVGSLVDDTTTWGERLVLDGFSYGRLGDGAPLDVGFRVGWLERQDPLHLGAQFRAQPWRRLIRVLRRMGHEHEAGSIGLQREHWLRRIGQVGSWAPPTLRWLPRAGHRALGLLTGHGYRPGRLVAWLLAVWLLCAGVYWAAAEFGATQAAALATPAMSSSLAYSLDRLLPLINLSRDGVPAAAAHWSEALRWVGYVESGSGWLLVLLLLASLAGWLDRDRKR